MRFQSLLTVALAAFTLARVEAAPAVESAHSTRLAPRAPNSGFGTGRKIRGVNLGNWLVLEAWMQPELFAPYSGQGAIDTWTLMKVINNAASATSLLQGHYDSWITEDDFKQMKAAGLNTIRLPVPHYMFGDAAGIALKTTSGEPYIGSGLEIPYVDKALRWAKQYGLDVTFDMHTAPYSQNGFDNSGRQGPVGFRNEGGNPADNVNRLIFALTESVKRWVNDPSYGGVIKSIGVLNEPQMWNGNLTRTWMVSQVHKPAYKAIMGNITSSAPIIPSITFHDGFDQPLSDWDSSYTTAQGYTAGTTSLDTHRYQAWAPQVNYNWDQHISYTCGLSSELSNANKIRPTFVGEFSLATRCTNCSFATMSDNINAQNNATQNLFMRRYWEAQQATYEKSAGWIMWSWKTSSRGDWSYKDAMAQGWIPSNLDDYAFARDSNGCPTNNLRKAITFATTSYPQTNSTGNSTVTNTATITGTNTAALPTTTTSTTTFVVTPTTTTTTRVTTPVATPTTAVTAPNGYRISWSIQGKRSSYAASTGFISRSTLGQTWLGGSQANTCAANCEKTRGCAMAELIRFNGGQEGAAVCALYKTYQQQSTVTYTSGPNGAGAVVTSYAIRRNAGAVKKRQNLLDDIIGQVVNSLIPLIPSTGKRIDQNVYPFLKKTTFNFGPYSH